MQQVTLSSSLLLCIVSNEIYVILLTMFPCKLYLINIIQLCLILHLNRSEEPPPHKHNRTHNRHNRHTASNNNTHHPQPGQIQHQPHNIPHQSHPYHPKLHDIKPRYQAWSQHDHHDTKQSQAEYIYRLEYDLYCGVCCPLRHQL